MAIALDTSAEANANSASDSFSFTVTGTDMVLFVSATVASASSGFMSAVTYNGVSLTKITEVLDATTGSSTYLWVLSGPATGAHTLAATYSSAVWHQLGVVSYSGAASFSGAAVDNSTTGSINTGATLTTTMTPNASDCWMVLAGTSGFTTTINASTGTTGRQSGALVSSAGLLGDTNAAVNGSSSMIFTTTGNDRIRSIMASFAPVAAAVGHPTMRRWGGTPFMGGQGIGQKGLPGRTWGRSRIAGLWVPKGEFA